MNEPNFYHNLFLTTLRQSLKNYVSKQPFSRNITNFLIEVRQISQPRSKTRKPRKSRKSRKFFSEVFKSKFSILAVGQNRIGNTKTWDNFSEISDFSELPEFSIFSFFKKNFFSIF